MTPAASGRDAARKVFAPSFPEDSGEFFARFVKPGGEPWSYDRHEYLRGPVEDQAKRVVIEKAAQLGFSTILLGRMIQWCLAGRKVGYYLPTKDFVGSFVQDRLDPLINADDELARATLEGKAQGGAAVTARLKRKQADNLRLKHIGQGTAWFLGLQSWRDVKSVDLDVVLLDEFTELDPELVVWLDDRTLHSQHARHWEISQPGVPDFGIDASYLASDRKRWLIRCGRCRHWADLPNEFPDCLVEPHPGDWRIVCVRCGARLHRDRGEWVPECPGAESSGYQASQLYGPFITPAEVAARWAAAQRTPSVLKNFTISILGKPFAGDDQPLNEGVLATACEPDRGLGPVPGAISYYAGIDQGDVSYIVVGARCPDGKVRICHVEQTTDWARLARVLLDFNCLFAVIDAQPGKSEAKRLMRTEGVAGGIAYFSGQGLQTGIEDEKTSSPVVTVKADRTEAIDDMAGHFGPCREWLLPAARLEVVQTVKQHCYKLVKVRDRLGKDSYAKGVTNHYGLALTYLDLAIRAADALGLSPATPLGEAEDWYTQPAPRRVF